MWKERNENRSTEDFGMSEKLGREQLRRKGAEEERQGWGKSQGDKLAMEVSIQVSISNNQRIICGLLECGLLDCQSLENKM